MTIPIMLIFMITPVVVFIVVVALGLFQEVVDGPGELELNVRGHGGHDLQAGLTMVGISVANWGATGSPTWGT